MYSKPISKSISKDLMSPEKKKSISKKLTEISISKDLMSPEKKKSISKKLTQIQFVKTYEKYKKRYDAANTKEKSNVVKDFAAKTGYSLTRSREILKKPPQYITRHKEAHQEGVIEGAIRSHQPSTSRVETPEEQAKKHFEELQKLHQSAVQAPQQQDQAANVKQILQALQTLLQQQEPPSIIDDLAQSKDTFKVNLDYRIVKGDIVKSKSHTTVLNTDTIKTLQGLKNQYLIDSFDTPVPKYMVKLVNANQQVYGMLAQILGLKKKYIVILDDITILDKQKKISV